MFSFSEEENYEWKNELKLKHYRTKFVQPVQTIKIRYPQYIAFSNNGDMFVTSDVDDCIHVYDKSGNKKTTIGSKRSGELQFNNPHGIDIKGDIVYVCERSGNRIHMLTTRGEFIGTFGKRGSGIGQFNYPYNIKISPDGKIYVADTFNDRVQVFHLDWSISHVINGRSVSGDGSFTRPHCIAFDLSNNVHVTAGYIPSSVIVFTPTGQFIRRYDATHDFNIYGIAINSSGYSFVTSWYNGTLSVFDRKGKLIHSVGGFRNPRGVSVSPTDGGVWVADTGNDRLVKY